ncbi:MAG: pyrroline-5-carboxylate reductase, partial [Candidatus Eisenbacteria bacterium]|nr:pyrroline-5-carboxylate reductase [Candidatus Eisenbacteria bacterium]
MKVSGRVAVIGVGTMGEAIVRGLKRRKLVASSRLRGTVRTQTRAKELNETLGIRIGTDNAEAVRTADVVVFCLKPQNVVRTIQTLARSRCFAHQPLLISIAAGVTSREIEEAVGAPCPVIRAMPNTPCAIARGTTVISRGKSARASHVRTAHAIFDPLGLTLELEEKHFNTVTGLSGSGPAFGYLMIESLADGGVMMGLPRAVATLLAART